MNRSTARRDLIRMGEPATVVERERIARGLYEHGIHRLFGIGLGLQALASENGDPAVSSHLEECVRELDLVISDLRAFIFDLGHRNV